MNKIYQLYARDGYCFANRDEDQIFYNCVWITDDYKNYFHEITIERAKEIKDKYIEKYYGKK